MSGPGPQEWAALALLPHTVYRAYSAYDRLLYIGISVEPVTRAGGHKHGRANGYGRWFSQADYFSVTWYGDRNEAHAAEVEAIKAEHPVFNIQHSVCRCGRGVTRCSVCQSSFNPQGRSWPVEHQCPATWLWERRSDWQVAPEPVRSLDVPHCYAADSFCR